MLFLHHYLFYKELQGVSYMKKIELEILALSHSVTQSHSYAVVLGEKVGNRRLPVVIGGFEAQAIAVALEKMKPTRPLTHDLMKGLFENFNVELEEIIINELRDGIFFAKLVCRSNGESIEIDSRTSDAMALAVRFECPIYTYENIMEQAGISVEEGEGQEGDLTVKAEPSTKETSPKGDSDITQFSMAELEEMLKSSLEQEDYEKAAKIRDELNRRKSDS